MTIVVALGLSTALMAGGDIAPITPATQVSADKDFYVGVGVTAGQTYLDGDSNWFKDGKNAETGYGLQATVGYTFYRNGAFEAAVEGRVQDTMWAYFDSDADADLLTYSALLKPEYNFGDTGVYALVGYGVSKFDSDYGSVRETGFVWGLGADYAITDTVAIYTDYVVNPDFKVDGESIKNDTVAIGVTYKF